MNTIEIDQGLNGFLGNILQNIINPSPDQSEQLANELYYKEQEIQKLKQRNTITMVITGISGLAAIFFGIQYVKYKKK